MNLSVVQYQLTMTYQEKIPYPHGLLIFFTLCHRKFKEEQDEMKSDK